MPQRPPRPPGDYEIGYGKPPKEHQFRPGQSGNPRGRPKGRRNLKTDLAEELAETILVREGERTRKVSKQQAMVKSLTAKAIKGDARSTRVLIDLMARLLDIDGASSTEAPITDDDRAVLDEVEARLLRRAQARAAAVADEDPT